MNSLLAMLAALLGGIGVTICGMSAVFYCADAGMTFFPTMLLFVIGGFVGIPLVFSILG